MSLAALTFACGGSSSSAASTSTGEPGEGHSAAPDLSPAEPQWRLPAGGAAVEVVPEGSWLRAVDAFGNLWLEGCSGLFVVHEGGIQRYRYLDTTWVRGAVSVAADAHGRIWLDSTGLSLIEAGRVQELRVPDSEPLLELAFGGDGVAWALTFDQTRSTQSGWYRFQAFHPEIAPGVLAPRWARYPVAGRDGALWVGADEEIYRFAEGRFWGPFAFPSSVANHFYDPHDDTLGVVHDGELTRLAFDASGGSLVEVKRQPVFWNSAIGRLSDGRLAVDDYQDAADGSLEHRVLVLDADDSAGITVATGDDRPLLSASRELYLQTPRGVARYRDGQVEQLLTFARQPLRPSYIWQEQGYGGVLRAPAQEATGGDLEPLVPAVLHQKLHLKGRMYVAGFEAPTTLELVDGGHVQVSIAPELRVFAEAQGIQLLPPFDEGRLAAGASPEKGEPWDLYGYLQPASCDSQPSEKWFYLVEAYPVSMTSAQRAALADSLRTAHPD